ncbi:MAG: insulinase family protein, partial [Bdellovibrionales bacterium]
MGVCGTVCWTLIVTFFVGAGGALEAKTLQSTQTVTKRGQTWSTFRLTNGLRVLLISDARFQKASAAMVVPVGSWSDPKGQEGLAHYLEHMLFLGTQDFPRAGEFDEYLSTNGGYSNAYTARDHTNYFFEVNSSAYSGGLHRFSQFFVSPTFDAAFVERDKNAVHNEFATILKIEYRRYDHILSIAGTEGHPGQRFLIGSKETL